MSLQYVAAGGCCRKRAGRNKWLFMLLWGMIADCLVFICWQIAAIMSDCHMLNLRSFAAIVIFLAICCCSGFVIIFLGHTFGMEKLPIVEVIFSTCILVPYAHCLVVEITSNCQPQDCVFADLLSGNVALKIIQRMCCCWVDVDVCCIAVPGYISRSVAGSYDNEGIAIFALMFTYFLWVSIVLVLFC